MKLTCPSMGSIGVAMSTLCAKHGVEFVSPPPMTNHTLSLGTKYAPEWMCLPYKILLGNLIEALDLGADTLIDVRGPGLCRLGYYARLHEETLRDLGYRFHFFTFDWQAGQMLGLAKFLRNLFPTRPPWLRIFGDLKFAMQQIMLMEEIERRLHRLRPRTSDQAGARRIWREAQVRIASALAPAALRGQREAIFAELEALPKRADGDPLRVAIVGEFYLVLNAFANNRLEEELGFRGAEVIRSAYLTEWANKWMILEMLGMRGPSRWTQAAKPYLSRDVSGDAVDSLGRIVALAQDGFDGVVYVSPFTCTPETVAHSILPRLQHDWDIPVLPLIFDEQTASTGFVTRIEAFVDLLERRRRKRAGDR